MGGGTGPASVASDQGSVLKVFLSVSLWVTKESTQLTNKANSSAKHKEAIQHANVEILLCLFASEAARVAQQINHRHCHNAVHV